MVYNMIWMEQFNKVWLWVLLIECWEKKRVQKEKKDDHTDIFLTDCEHMKLDYNTFKCILIVHNIIVKIKQLSDVIAFG